MKRGKTNGNNTDVFEICPYRAKMNKTTENVVCVEYDLHKCHWVFSAAYSHNVWDDEPDNADSHFLDLRVCNDSLWWIQDAQSGGSGIICNSSVTHRNFPLFKADVHWPLWNWRKKEIRTGAAANANRSCFRCSSFAISTHSSWPSTRRIVWTHYFRIDSQCEHSLVNNISTFWVANCI